MQDARSVIKSLDYYIESRADHFSIMHEASGVRHCCPIELSGSLAFHKTEHAHYLKSGMRTSDMTRLQFTGKPICWPQVTLNQARAKQQRASDC